MELRLTSMGFVLVYVRFGEGVIAIDFKFAFEFKNQISIFKLVLLYFPVSKVIEQKESLTAIKHS